jgi:hypothetical protein
MSPKNGANVGYSAEALRRFRADYLAAREMLEQRAAAGKPRPSTAEAKRLVREHFLEAKDVEEIMSMVGRTVKTWEYWKKTDKEFCEAINRARAEGRHPYEKPSEAALRRAESPEPEPHRTEGPQYPDHPIPPPRPMLPFGRCGICGREGRLVERRVGLLACLECAANLSIRHTRQIANADAL